MLSLRSTEVRIPIAWLAFDQVREVRNCLRQSTHCVTVHPPRVAPACRNNPQSPSFNPRDRHDQIDANLRCDLHAIKRTVHLPHAAQHDDALSDPARVSCLSERS